MATVIRRPDIDRDPLLLAVALANARAEVASEEAVAGLANEDPALSAGDEAKSDLDPDMLGAQVMDEAAAPSPEALLEQIEAQRVQVLEQAYQDGFRAGEEAGSNAARHVRDSEIETVRQIAESMHSAFDGFLNDAEDLLVEIAFEAVCKILGRALCEREGVNAMVREVIDQVREREQVIVRLAPADFTLLTAGDGPAMAVETLNVQLKPDERVALGGCLIDSPSGTLDGRLETQLQRLREVLVAARAVNTDGTV